ncbi:MAG: RrF2 family transcriptional regulator [Eubacteriales bacterium]|nr:RrF2 family transcriptional regulator [Eubacteriales bacterium]
MMVSTKGRYALRVMIDIAQNENDTFVSLKEVAQRQGISIKYLEAIVAVLNKAGMLDSKRGKEGGYRLSMPTEAYRISEILKLTEGSLVPVSCMEDGGCVNCSHNSDCYTLPLWNKLDELIEGYLSGITLEDLINGNI